MPAVICNSSGGEFATWWAKLMDLGIVPPFTRRVIIDLELNKVARVYYECHGDGCVFDDPLLNILKGADRIVADIAPPCVESSDGKG